MGSKFRNCGQTCVSANRFLVEKEVFDKFVSKLQKAMETGLLMGDGKDPKTTIGPLINKTQANNVAALVKDAIDKGAKVVTGGKASSHGALFYEPTILTNITDNMRVYRDEIFGPVVVCIKFEGEECALEIANDVPVGLASYFYSQDIAQVFRVARRLETGMVGANEGAISTAEAAFGGVKESGIGREGSSHGIDDYVHIKYLCLGSL